MSIEPEYIEPNISEELKPKYHALAMRKIYGVEKLAIRYPEAENQILRNDLINAARKRDEYKMQLDAANKEIKILKEKLKNEKDNNS